MSLPKPDQVFSNSASVLAVVCLGFLSLVPISKAQQTTSSQTKPALQITSPLDGAIVSPGQDLILSVISPAGVAVSEVAVIGEIGTSTSSASSVPSQLSVVIPSKIELGRHRLAALGTTVSGQIVNSNPIEIDLERPDFPMLLSTNFRTLDLESQGETQRLQVFGTFAGSEVGGEGLEVTHSSYVTYSSSNPAVATVDAAGNVTAQSFGDAVITATYTLGEKSNHAFVQVTVQHPMLTTSPTRLEFASQSTGTKSAPQQIIVTNVVENPVSILSVTAEGDFAETDDCVALSPLGPNGTCSINVTFSPTFAVPMTGTLFISNSANTIPIAVSLSGNGTPNQPSK